MENPTKDNIIKAYNVAKEQGADSTCKVLETLYPDIDFTPVDNRPITERIKTFEDAVAALGESHILVQTYRDLGEFSGTIAADDNRDLIAYVKLRIIVAALNEGWKPEFVEDEWRWYPWFYLYTKEELEEKDEDWKQSHTILLLNGRVVGRSYSGAHAGGGLVYASANDASSYAHTSSGARLAFKSGELAEYAGKQFIDIYADFILAH